MDVEQSKNDRDYAAGQLFLRINAEKARSQAAHINSRSHPYLDPETAEEVFIFHPSLMGRNIDSLVLQECEQGVRPILSIVGYDFAPEFVLGPVVMDLDDAPRMGRDLLALAYSVILRVRESGQIGQESVFIFGDEQKILISHEFIRSSAHRYKWPQSLTAVAGSQLIDIMRTHARKAIEETGSIDLESLTGTKLKLAASYAIWAGLGNRI